MIQLASDNCWFSILSFASCSIMIWVLIDWLTLGIVIKCYFVLYKAMNALLIVRLLFGYPWSMTEWGQLNDEAELLAQSIQHNSASLKHSLHLFLTYPLNFHFLWFPFILKSTISNSFTYFTMHSVPFTPLQSNRFTFTHNLNSQ